MKSAATSQCDRVLAVLKDGRPHTMEEIHQYAGFMRLNSRISDLRHRGYDIKCRREDGHYVYQLGRALDEPEDAIGRLTSGSSSVPAAASDKTAQPPSPEPSGTLLLFDLPRRGAYGDAA